MIQLRRGTSGRGNRAVILVALAVFILVVGVGIGAERASGRQVSGADQSGHGFPVAAANSMGETVTVDAESQGLSPSLEPPRRRSGGSLAAYAPLEHWAALCDFVAEVEVVHVGQYRWNTESGAETPRANANSPFRYAPVELKVVRLQSDRNDRPDRFVTLQVDASETGGDMGHGGISSPENLKPGLRGIAFFNELNAPDAGPVQPYFEYLTDVAGDLEHATGDNTLAGVVVRFWSAETSTGTAKEYGTGNSESGGLLAVWDRAAAVLQGE